MEEKIEIITYIFERRDITNPSTRTKYNEWIEKTSNLKHGFATTFSCTQGQELAVSDAKHDFGYADEKTIQSTIPRCGKGNINVDAYDESIELEKILDHVIGAENLTDSMKTILISGGDLQITGDKTGWGMDSTKNKEIEGYEYTAYDMGSLGWASDMSIIGKKDMKIKGKFSKTIERTSKLPELEEIVIPTLQMKIQEAVNTNKVYIIDDIHSSAFIENIKGKPTDKTNETFWCYLQTAQTIFDPAGKITPKTKPDVFNSGNVEYGWQDIRKDKKQGLVTSGEIESMLIQYPPMKNGIISDTKEKMTLKNDVYMTIKGNPIEPTSHKVNFFSQINNNKKTFAVFDNQSSAIKNRNYMSTSLIDEINEKRDKLSASIGLKAHYVAKRFGDQGQANVTCDASIPYITQSTKGSFISQVTNGNHMFVSKDRLAIGAALLFNSPFVLHLKAGKPKDKLHNILYIRNDLREISKKDYDNVNIKVANTNKEIIDIFENMITIVDRLRLEVKTQTEKFNDILESQPDENLLTYIKNINDNITPYLIGKVTEKQLSSLPDKLDDIDPLEWNNRRSLPNMRKQINQKTKEIQDRRVIIDQILNLTTEERIDELQIDKTTGDSRSPRRIPTTPDNISELRTLWKPIYEKLYMHTDDDVIPNIFTETCVSKVPNLSNNKESNASILISNTPEIIRENGNGNAPTYTRSQTGTQTQVITDDQIMIDKPIDKFKGSGNRLNVKPDEYIRTWLKTKAGDVQVDGWIEDIELNSNGQQISSRLLNLRFVRDAMVLLYDIPELLKYDYYTIDKLNSDFIDEYVDDGLSSGFAPDIFYGFDESVISTDNDVHTEIDNFVRGYGELEGDIESQFMSLVLDIIWKIQNTKDSIRKFTYKSSLSSLVEPEKRDMSRLTGVKTDEDAKYKIDERQDDMDPIIEINKYARDLLMTDASEFTESDVNTSILPSGWLLKPDSSIRIIIKTDGFVDKRCGFYKNCLLPTMRESKNLYDKAIGM
jgi:hypothetical protein